MTNKITKEDLVNIAVSQRESELVIRKRELTKEYEALTKEHEQMTKAEAKALEGKDKTKKRLVDRITKERLALIKQQIKNNPKIMQLMEALKEVGIKGASIRPDREHFEENNEEDEDEDDEALNDADGSFSYSLKDFKFGYNIDGDGADIYFVLPISVTESMKTMMLEYNDLNENILDEGESEVLEQRLSDIREQLHNLEREMGDLPTLERQARAAITVKC